MNPKIAEKAAMIYVEKYRREGPKEAQEYLDRLCRGNSQTRRDVKKALARLMSLRGNGQ